MLRPRHLELGKETDRETEGERDPEKEREQGQSWGSPDKDWGSGQAWGGAWGLGGWRRREGASRAGVPRAAGGRRAEPGPAAAAEPGAGPAPPPRRDVSGATLKGAGRPPRVGAGAGGGGQSTGVTATVLRDPRGAPASSWAESRKPKSLQRRRDARAPRGSLRSFGAQSPPNTQTQTHHSTGLPGSGTTFSISPSGEGPHLWGEGSAAVSAGNCSLLGLFFARTPPTPTPATGSGQRGPSSGSLADS